MIDYRRVFLTLHVLNTTMIDYTRVFLTFHVLNTTMIDNRRLFFNSSRAKHDYDRL